MTLFEGTGVIGALDLQSRLAEGTAEPTEAKDDTDHPPGMPSSWRDLSS